MQITFVLLVQVHCATVFNERATCTFYPLESTSSTEMGLQRGEEVWTDRRRKEVCLIAILSAHIRRYAVNETGNYRKGNDDIIIGETECRDKHSYRQQLHFPHILAI